MADAETITMKKISTDTPVLSPITSQTLSLSKPTTASVLPRAAGVNILQTANTFEFLKAKLERCGLEIKRILHFVYSDGSMRPRLLYCQTLHGQYVIVESPEGLIAYGELSILEQRVGVLPTNILEKVEQSLKGIYTGYAYISGGGIHYVSRPGAEPKYFGYENYKEAKSQLDIRKWNYHLVPAVSWDRLIEPERLNTLEAHIATIMAGSLTDQLIRKAELTAVLTSSGPWTLFLPTDDILQGLLSLSEQKLKDVLLAHLINDRIDYQVESSVNPQTAIPSGQTLTPATAVPTLSQESKDYRAVAQNEIRVHRVKGTVTGLTTPDNKKVKILSDGHQRPVHKYNGVLYRIDQPLKPNVAGIRVPTQSDFDDVVTVFDISRTTMEIRVVQHQLNQMQIERMAGVLTFINQGVATIQSEIAVKSSEDGAKLINDSNNLLNLFFTREVPCSDLCVELDQLTSRVQDENLKYDRILKASNRLSSLRFKLEKVLLSIARIDQKLHVENPIDKIAEEDSSEDQ